MVSGRWGFTNKVKVGEIWTFKKIQIRAGVLVLSTRTRSTRVLNFWYSYFTRKQNASKNVYKMTTVLSKPQYVNLSPPSAAYVRQWTGSALVQVMIYRLFDAKPLPEPILSYCQLSSYEQIECYKTFHSWKSMHLKMCSAKLVAILSKWDVF